MIVVGSVDHLGQPALLASTSPPPSCTKDMLQFVAKNEQKNEQKKNTHNNQTQIKRDWNRERTRNTPSGLTANGVIKLSSS